MKYVFALAFLLQFPATASAEFRCPNTGKIVKEGMNPYEVESVCGAPAHKQPLSSSVKVEGNTVASGQSEEWTYDFGSSQFIQKLEFVNGSLKTITQGDYGTKTKGH
jgi:Protein of unknown function (DUF2845)